MSFGGGVTLRGGQTSNAKKMGLCSVVNYWDPKKKLQNYIRYFANKKNEHQKSFFFDILNDFFPKKTFIIIIKKNIIFPQI